MKSNVLVLFSLLAAASSFAADGGGSGGPQVTGMFRIVKPDGATVIKQAVLSTSPGVMGLISVGTADAFIAASGKCAFNVQYDEVSPVAALNTTNRLYANDVLVAQNTRIDLKPGVTRTIWTQPYLKPGPNNVKLVINAESAAPSIAWVRVTVAGTCGAPEPKPAPAATPEKKPPPPPAPPAVVKFAPGSTEWNVLNTAWGYSNYATTQLKTKGYARYADLVKLNIELTTVINAKSVEQARYNELMARWNSFATDPAFKAAMTALPPPTPGKK